MAGRDLKLSPKPLSDKGNTHACTRNIKIEDFDDLAKGYHEEPARHITKEKLDRRFCP